MAGEVTPVEIAEAERLAEASGLARRAAGERTELYWADLVHPETAVATLVNVRYPVHRAEAYMGTLAATVRIDQLSQLLAETADTLGGNAFILYGEDAVLAHPKLVDGFEAASVEHPLPTVAEIDDVILATYRAGEDSTRQRAVIEERTGIRLIEVEGESYAFLARALDGYGDAPWLAGVRRDHRRIAPPAVGGDHRNRRPSCRFGGGVRDRALP